MGKTTSIREFAREHYQNFVEVNFEKTPIARNAFSGALDARTIIMNLSAMGFGPFVKGETLVFFDEIQSCPQARTAIKFLVEDGSFHHIESGSLLGINYKEVSSFPVGYEHQVEMFPLDFEEFLWASGISDDVISTLRQCYENLQLVPDFIHQQVMQGYSQYLIVGGMPEIVNAFLSNPNLGYIISLQTDLLAGYRNELDFVYSEGNKMTVIVVKSGKDYKKHTLLDNALQLYPDRMGRAMVLGKMNVEQGTGGIIYLPLYMTMFL